MIRRFVSRAVIFVLLISLLPVTAVFSTDELVNYSMVDISPYTTSKAYLLQIPITFADAVQYPHDYVFYDNYDNCIAINKEHLASKLSPEGVLEDRNGVPFHMPLDLAIEVRANGNGKTYVPSTTINLKNRPYERINFLAVSARPRTQDIHIDINYTDGTKTTFQNFYVEGHGINADVDNFVCKVNAFVYWGSGNYVSAANYIGIGSYSVQPVAGKPVDSITFRSSSYLNGCKVLAVTTEGKSVSGMINDLPEASNVTSENFDSVLSMLYAIEQIMTEDNITEADLSVDALERLMSIRNKINELKIEIIAGLIDELPDAEDITTENFTNVETALSTVEQNMELSGITEDELDENSIGKLDRIRQRIIVVKKENIILLIIGLPEAQDITPQNFSNIEQAIFDIFEKMAQESLTEDDLDVTFISKINSIRAIIDNIRNSFNMVDISPFATSKAYISSTSSTVLFQDANVQYPHDYIPYDNYDNCIAISKLDLASMLDEQGILYSKSQIPFSMPMDLAIEVRANGSGKTYVPSTEVNLSDRVYSHIYFLASSVNGTLKEFHIDVNYKDGTRATYQNFETKGRKINQQLESFVCEVDAFVYWGSGNYSKALKYIDIGSYSIQVDTQKVIDSITFRSTNRLVPIKVLAITTVEPDVAFLKNWVENKIDTLIHPNGDKSTLLDIRQTLDRLAVRGVGEQEISGIEKFYHMYDRVVYVSGHSTVVSVSNIDTNIVFLNPVDEKTVNKKNITVKHGTRRLSENEYTLQMIKTGGGVKEVLVRCANSLDYEKSYKIELSRNIHSTLGSNFTLHDEFMISFVPNPPFELSEFVLTDEQGNTINSLSGKTGLVNVKAVLKNNSNAEGQSYAVTIGLYSRTGKMEQCITSEGALSLSETEEIHGQLTLPSDTSGYTVECYIVDSYTGLKLIYLPQIRQ